MVGRVAAPEAIPSTHGAGLAEDLTFGEELSDTVSAALPELVNQVVSEVAL